MPGDAIKSHNPYYIATRCIARMTNHDFTAARRWPTHNDGARLMASIGGSYNPDAEPSAGYTPLPAGEYQMEIVESDYVATQKGTGMILKCKAQIVGGEFDGRPYYLNYNLENDNDQAREIGQRDFAGLRRATGVLAPEESDELHFKTFSVKIGVKARKDNGEMENVIRQYLFEDEEAAPADAPVAAARPAARPAAAQPTARAKPWK